MKSVLHAEVLAALRRVASVPRVRLEGRGNRSLHILVLWTLQAVGEVVLKQHNLLEGSLLLQLGVRHEVGRHLVNQGLLRFGSVRMPAPLVLNIVQNMHGAHAEGGGLHLDKRCPLVLRLVFGVKIPWRVLRLHDSIGKQLVPIMPSLAASAPPSSRAST